MQQKSFELQVDSADKKSTKQSAKGSIKAASPTPELHEVRPSDEGGVIAIQGLDYQYHFTLGKCLDLLLKPHKYEFVSSETHDDVVIKRCDGTYEFCQVKRKSEGKWKLTDLQRHKIWTNFLRFQRIFGRECKFKFISDQTSQRGTRFKYDLSDMKKVTKLGKRLCNAKDELIAKNLIERLCELLKVDHKDKEEIECLFWNTRILTDYERERGLRSLNMGKLHRLLNSRGVTCDAGNLERIYQDFKRMIIDRIIPDPELSYEEVLLRRQIYPADVEKRINGPFTSPTFQHFTLDTSANTKSLIDKTNAAGFPAHIEKFFVESRNYFSVKYYENMPYSADYLANLRMKVWGICVEKQINLENRPPMAQYSAIYDALKQLASEEEISHDAPFYVDMPYLHGMLCQLTAECHHDWYKLGDS